MGKPEGKILIIDDDLDVLYTARIVLKPHFEIVRTESAPGNIINLLRKEDYDVILLDMNFTTGATTGKEGLYWLKRILSHDSDIQVVMDTAYGDIQLAVDAMKLGAADFLIKPWEKEKLKSIIKSTCELSRTRKKYKGLEEHGHYSEVTSVATSMRKVYKTLDKVAVTDANILLLGENGTGKEVLARKVHRSSPRSGGPFVVVDLGSITETLFESELFGHTKGAFTDAKENKTGRFALADGGTLFLDEVGNLSLPLQAKLLSAIQTKQVYKVGSNQPLTIDVRLICATNKPIYEMMGKEQFRQDLLYRINTVVLDLPPLRERMEDIPVLANHFLKFYGTKYKKGNLSITEGGMQDLIKYQWPGNIREFRHAVERAVIMGSARLLKSQDFLLKTEIDLYKALEKEKRVTDTLNLEELEAIAIKEAISECHGNLSWAAKKLGLSRTTLYRKITKYGL